MIAALKSPTWPSKNNTPGDCSLLLDLAKGSYSHVEETHGHLTAAHTCAGGRMFACLHGQFGCAKGTSHLVLKALWFPVHLGTARLLCSFPSVALDSSYLSFSEQ